MSKSRLAIFFTIFFTLYGLINFYIYFHGLSVVPGGHSLLYSIVFWFFAMSFIAGRFLERRKITVVSNFLVWTGSLWLAAMLYFLIAVALIDILQLINHFIHFLPALNGETIFIVVIVAVLITVTAGFVNARNPRVKPLDIRIDKSLNNKIYKIVAVSDIHLGTIIGTRRLTRIVNKINAQDADIVLFPGDVVDEDITPVINQNLGEVLKAIKSRLGVYSVTGNHEYIGGVDKAVNYLRDHGVRVLRDETVFVDNAFYIIGREDLSYNGYAHKKRKDLSELLSSADKNFPLILMDHQPYHLEDAEMNNIDLQLSGHTHHAQLWPLNFITKKIYEVSWGYKKKGSTHIYVSCGAGTWGPPVRLGNTPEIMVITLRGK